MGLTWYESLEHLLKQPYDGHAFPFYCPLKNILQGYSISHLCVSIWCQQVQTLARAKGYFALCVYWFTWINNTVSWWWRKILWDVLVIRTNIINQCDFVHQYRRTTFSNTPTKLRAQLSSKFPYNLAFCIQVLFYSWHKYVTYMPLITTV